MKYYREDYLDGRCTHREYNAQFIGVGIKDAVARGVGIDRLLGSADEHLNDIPLRVWDRLAPLISAPEEYRDGRKGQSLCHQVCVLKEAAKQVIEAARSAQEEN